MALPQQKFREILLMLLYSHDFSRGDEEDSTAMVMRELSVAKKYVLEAHDRRRLIEEKLEAIDRMIAEVAVSYEFARIPGIERNILRLGAYELFHVPSLPPKVALAEAVRLSRKFASPEGATFVNAILDALYQRTRDIREEDKLPEPVSAGEAPL